MNVPSIRRATSIDTTSYVSTLLHEKQSVDLFAARIGDGGATTLANGTLRENSTVTA
jgi:hypothetical protein